MTSKFMRFAEEFLTSKKGDPRHNPTVSPCLVRVPRTTNLKCSQEVKVLQRWDGQRPVINYLLRDFRRWLINEKIKQRLASCRKVRALRPHIQIQSGGLKSYYKLP